MSTYNELLEKKKAALESKYITAFNSDDIEGICEALKEMMQYRVINECDDRLSKKKQKDYKEYWDTVSKDIEHYKTTRGNIPDNILFKSPSVMHIDVLSEKHWTKRVELQYEGDIIAEDKIVNYSIFEKVVKESALSAAYSMEKLYKKLFGLDDLKLNKDLIRCGCSRMYDISLSNYTAFRIRKLGYIYVSPFKDGVKVTVLLDHNEMIDICIDVKKTYENLEGIIKAEFKSVGVNNLKFNYLANIEKVSKYQHSIVRREPTFDIIGGGKSE